MRWVDATDLKRWADRLDSRSTLPILVRRLIHATLIETARVAFPGGESIQRPGWDGIVETNTTHPFVPQGPSAWELGTDQDIKGKADDDYTKRTVDPGVIVPAQTTFVFVTPRRWTKKEEWTTNRQAEGIWRDVRAYDADDLEQWLELAPAVGSWLAMLIGKYADGVQSVEDWWHEYAQRTSPALPKSLVLAERQAAQEQVRKWATGSASALLLVADAPSEAFGFVAAVLIGEESLSARALVLRDSGVLRRIATTTLPLIILWDSDDLEIVGGVVARGHHVLVPAARGADFAAPNADVLRLPRLSSDAVTSALVETGLPEERARLLTRECGRSIPVLQRRIPAAGRPALPPWAAPEIAPSLLPAMLAGSWRATHVGDRETLGSLAGTTYAVLSETLLRWSQENDAPVRRIGDHWLLTAPVDAWHLLAPRITDMMMERFVRIALEVLSERDPALDLPKDSRWAHTIYKAEFTQSAEFRAGIAQTLALLGTSSIPIGSSTSATVAARVVRDVLGGHLGWERWYSVQGVLPLLAEAAPDEFLRAAEEELLAPNATIKQLFAEEGWLHASAHTSLLWALESLAWFPEYLARVVVILARLTRLDPGGQLSNRPRASLLGIFRSWMPQTCARLKLRQQAIELLLQKEEDVAWQLLLDLLPETNAIATPAATPSWRERPLSVPVTRAECMAADLYVSDRAVAVAGTHPPRLAALIAKLANLPPPARTQLLENMRSYAAAAPDDADRRAVWDALRELVHTHRAFDSAHWALSDDLLRELEEILRLLRPKSPTVSAEWLFNDWWPDLPVPRDNAAALDGKTDEARKAALRDIWATMGLPGVLSLAQSVKYPGFVGRSLAELRVAQEREVLQQALPSAERSLQIFGAGMVTRLFTLCGSTWAEQILTEDGSAWGLEGKVVFLLALPTDAKTWDMMSGQPPEVIEAYWSRVSSYGVSAADASMSVEQLLAVGRTSPALRIASQYCATLPSEVVIRILDCFAVTTGEAEPVGDVAYALSQALDGLTGREDVPESELARLEWLYLPLLDGPRGLRAPVLQRMALSDPSCFAYLIACAYRPHGQPRAEAITQNAIQRGKNAHVLLSSLRGIPGMNADGTLDASALRSWVDGVRAQCKESGHEIVGDQHIGQVLAHAPIGADGAWPHPAVRDLLENLELPEVEKGLRIGVHNQRGGTSRAWAEGGAQERTLAQQYRTWADITGIRWPRTTALLTRLASDYEREATQEDEKAELDKTRWG